jgi:deazaflavin-dependent oxidoreductase (nitroreductase family)
VTTDVTGRPYCYLTTTGRRTGASHRIEIWFALDGGVVYLLSGGRDRSDWVRNIAANPEVTLELGEQVRRCRARWVDAGSPEDARARSLLLAKYQPGEAEDLSSWGASALPVAVAWDEGLSQS